eukprot:scaffold2208_cov170-Ochromonas_danica.AAC.31
MGCKVDEIVFVRVLWTSRPTTFRDSSDDFCVLIDSAHMLNYWSERVRTLVVQEKLSPYGFH